MKDLTVLRHRRPDAAIDAYEVRLTKELLLPDAGKDLRTVIYAPDEMLASGNAAPKAAFYEVEYGPRWFETIGFLFGALVESPERSKGLKVRCGGATAAAVPSAGDLAYGLAACRTVGVPVKFTAGLHHPLRHHDSALGTKSHGFLNVFVAGVLCHARGLGMEALRPILEDEDPAHFYFDDAGLAWNDLRATTEEVAAARRGFVVSFGSCSFDEPREDLRALGLL
jgi:hypothetical protein